MEQKTSMVAIIYIAGKCTCMGENNCMTMWLGTCRTKVSRLGGGTTAASHSEDTEKELKRKKQSEWREFGWQYV